MASTKRSLFNGLGDGMARGRSKAAKKSTKKSKNGDGGNLGFEADLFKAADKLRGNMEPSDYKHVALGLIFLKHISDSFEAKRSQLLAEYPDGAEDPDEYSAENVFWVPKEARWSQLLPPLGRPRNKNRRWRISHHGKYCLLSWLVRKSRARPV